MAVVWELMYFKYLICDQEVEVYTDHKPLAVLKSPSEPDGRIGRLLLKIQHLNYTIHYKPGKLNIVPDLLSRPFKTNSIRAIDWFSEQAKDPELA